MDVLNILYHWLQSTDEFHDYNIMQSQALVHKASKGMIQLSTKMKVARSEVPFRDKNFILVFK